MRLTCPNCGAQYEVPDDVIPPDGRDVQCSNCGTTWFQPHKDALDQQARTYDSEEDTRVTEDAPPQRDMPDQVPTPERRGLTSEVTDILQEEAAHEAKLRAEDAGGLETQPDLGLDDTADDAERRARQARERMERLRGPEPKPEPPAEEEINAAAIEAAAKASRRDRLPDIDEINSSLRSADPDVSPHPDDTEPVVEPPAKGGFARGFAIPLLVVALLVLLYAMAPQLSEAVPALSPVLTSYVIFVDQIRSWLNSQLGAIVS